MSPPTEILSDRWRLVDRIGEGAMGEVWRGQHVVLGHEVAIKLMKPEAAADRELVSRFRREARIAAMLRHRNLVRVEDFGATDDGRPFLVMELLRGRPLSAVLKQSGKLDRGTVALVAHHIGSACDIAHAAGIVHRDLKPDNCYVVADDDGAPLVKVLDFGVAKVLDGLFVTSTGVVTAGHALMGTPMYMSPEQARGLADLDARSDLWSIAVIVFEMLTGRLPYSAPTISQLLYAVLAGPIPPPSSIDRALGGGIDAWFVRALSRDRAQRFQSGRELSASLGVALGVSIPTPSVPPAGARELVPLSVGTGSVRSPPPRPSAPPPPHAGSSSMNATLLPAAAQDHTPNHRRGVSERPMARAESQHPGAGGHFASPTVPPHRPLPRTEAMQFAPANTPGYPPSSQPAPPPPYGYPTPAPVHHYPQHASAPYPAQGQHAPPSHPSGVPQHPVAYPQPQHAAYGAPSGYPVVPQGYAQPQGFPYQTEPIVPGVVPRQRGMGLLLVLAALFAAVMVTAVVLKVLGREANREERGLSQ